MANATTRAGRPEHWLVARRDPETAIESLRAHFTGHAYDPHDHDDMLIGYTEQGVRRFQCHRALHTSVPGRAILIEPGALRDGHPPEPGGFTFMFNTKVVLIVCDDLAVWQKLNVVAFLATGIAAALPDALGAP